MISFALKLCDKVKRAWANGIYPPRALRYNPYLGYIFRPFLQIRFLLPHDKTYYGFLHLVKAQGGLFLDVGANDGISAMGFHRIEKNYSIFSIEPNRDHEKSLKKIKNKIRNFDYKIMGAGSCSSQVDLYTPFYKGIPIYTASSCYLDHAKQGMEDQFGRDLKAEVVYKKQVVDVVKLDDLGLMPDIIKIDCEGSEYQVLLGLENTLKTCCPCVVFEFNPRYISGEIGFLESLGYEFFIYEFQSDRFKAFDPEKKEEWGKLGEFFFNVFCIPKQKAAHLLLRRS